MTGTTWGAVFVAAAIFVSSALAAGAAEPSAAERAAIFKAAGFKAKGAWTNILEGVGVPTPLDTKSQGWPDIEIGGPGFDEFPVHGYDGKSYVPKP